MAKAPAEMMREFVRSQNFTSTDEVMTAMKDMFKDILQEVMECELSDELGYEKSERSSNDECGKKSKNYRNDYSKKTVKTQMGELEIKVPRDRNGEYKPKIISKYNRNADGMERLLRVSSQAASVLLVALIFRSKALCCCSVSYSVCIEPSGYSMFLALSSSMSFAEYIRTEP